MIYQLPNGKVLYIAVEDYLLLTDEDILFIIAYHSGDEISSQMYYDTTISESSPVEVIDDFIEDSEDFDKPETKIKDIEGDLF